jgi:hypothetical protein
MSVTAVFWLMQCYKQFMWILNKTIWSRRSLFWVRNWNGRLQYVPFSYIQNAQPVLTNAFTEHSTFTDRGCVRVSAQDICIPLKANSHMPCHAHAIPLPCRAALIHTCHATPLPFSESTVSSVKVHMVARNIRTASPTVQWIGMLLITTFVELCMVARRSWTWEVRPNAVSVRPMLIHTYHAMHMPRCAMALRSCY